MSGSRYPLGRPSLPISTLLRVALILSLFGPAIAAMPDTILESNQVDSGSFDAAVFGGSVASAGDVNGDGFDDVVVGARGWDWASGLFDEGAAFVFLGGINGIGIIPSTVIQSTQASSEFGVSVAGAGDVNGDGFADIIVGSNFYDGILPGTALQVDGAAFVFHGGPTGILASNPDMADATITANQLDSFLGFSVAGAGDVNGDGFDDIIVGVPRQGSPTFPPGIPLNQGQGTGGAVLIFHGSAAGITGTGFDDADAVLLPYPAGFPEPSGTMMGVDVSAAGDVNGDGFDDVLVNANGVVVFLGSASGIVGTDPTTAHAQISGPGVVVSAAGDVNGDGFDDILVGNPGFPNITPGLPGFDAGTFGVFLGSAAGITATDFSQANTIVAGNSAGQQLGRRLANAGDVDNDGFDDIIIGAIGYAGSLDQEGAAYLFRGGPSGIVATTLLDAYVRLESNQSGAVRRLNRYEIDVAGIGDANGDGFADTLLGLGFFDVDQLNEGAVFIHHGATAPINPNQPPRADAGADQSIYDVDGDLFASVTLDGSASFDPDGSIMSYAWLEGETLLGTSPVVSTVLPATGLHTLVLTVTDDAGITRGDPVSVQVDIVNTQMIFANNFTTFDPWVIGGDTLLSSVDTFPTPPQARLGASGAFMRRSVTLPADATGMTLDFWAKASQFAPGDELRINVSVDGGPFTTIRTFTSADSNSTYAFYGGSAIPLGHSWFPDTAASLVLEFESSMTTGQFFVDDVELTALFAPLGGAATAPAEADGLLVDDFDINTGNISLNFTLACRAANHNVVYGALASVESYGYSGQVCDIGTSGSYTQFAPGSGSYFFLVVGTDGVATDGSYGKSSALVERPEYTGDPTCIYSQQIGTTCGAGNTTPPALGLQLAGVPATIQRGDFFTASVTIQNDGNATETGLAVEVSWDPPNSLRLESPQTTIQSVDPLPAGGQYNVQWQFRGESQGVSTITITLRDAESTVLTTSSAEVDVLN